VFDVLLVLLLLWVVLAIAGTLLTGLLWPVIVGAGLFLVTAGFTGARCLGPTDR
jgi:hypothetical protein